MKLHIGITLIAIVLVTLFYTYRELLPKKMALLEGQMAQAAETAFRETVTKPGELSLTLPPTIDSLTGLETEAGAVRALLKTSL